MRRRVRFAVASSIVFACSVVSTAYFGYKYDGWINYPSLGKTTGGPEYSVLQAHLWTLGLWTSVILGLGALATLLAAFFTSARFLRREGGDL